MERAKRLADALEVIFDSSVHCLGEKGVSDNEAQKIRGLMGSFINPIQHAEDKTPNTASVAAAYARFIAELDAIH
jgi:hypothetical protein